MWLARRAPLSRDTWRSALPVWVGFIILAGTLPEILLLLMMGNINGAGPPLFYILAIRFMSTGPLVLGAAALALAIEHRRRARAAAIEAANARAELVQAQLRSLTAQLRPHFLFNTLQSVSTLIHRDTEAADLMIGRLGELLRASLELGETPFIPLEQELRITSAYLGIMQERFGKRLDVSIETNAELETLVPPFLLQPVVENAVQHGIEPSRGAGRVHIRVTSEDDQLILEVHDTGAGRMNESANTGVGLSNTKRRLDALYGGKADLSIETDAASGTCVTISTATDHRTPCGQRCTKRSLSMTSPMRASAFGHCYGGTGVSRLQVNARTVSRRWPRYGANTPT
jgi:anti-sigma regulatory factor (Ser/Thr protein kinase)